MLNRDIPKILLISLEKAENFTFVFEGETSYENNSITITIPDKKYYMDILIYIISITKTLTICGHAINEGEPPTDIYLIKMGILH